MTYRKFGWVLIAVGLLLIEVAVSTHPIFRLVTALPDVLGFYEPKTYIVLLQNNTELRPTGGFLGSFALVAMDHGRPSIKVEDIYTPDGQVKGHVDPPAPIQEAFQLGEWRLRDANWDPDFPTAARQIEWFMEKGGVPDVDGVVATNLIVFEEVLKILGPLTLRDYEQTVTSNNLWELGQTNTQEGFFPGSTQKREFFSDLARETMNSASSLPLPKKLALFKRTLRTLEEKQLMAYLHEQRVQRALESFNWAGDLRKSSCPWNHPRCVPESLMIVEANLGVNKANCCVILETTLEIVPEETGIRHTLLLTWTNASSKEQWGGRYKAWVRIYANATEQTGFWVEVPENESRTYAVEYDLANTSNNPDYPIFLLVQKQSGITEFPMTIKIERKEKEREKTKEIKTVIRKDETFVL